MQTNRKTNDLFYEKPYINKYGTMKVLTLNSGGSNGDAFAGGNMPPAGGDPKPREVPADTGGGVNSDPGASGLGGNDGAATVNNSD